MEIKFPYGKKEISLSIPKENVVGMVKGKEIKPSMPLDDLLKNALSHPLGTKKISEMNGKNVVVVVDDKTRPLPTKKILPHIFNEINEDKNITILFATGTHAPMKKKDAYAVLGKEIAENYEWVTHDAKNAEFVELGTSSFGTPIFLNKAFMDADIKILVGDVELHYFAGYGGGRKSVLPGTAAESTVEHNHQMMFHENARFGILDGNPVHEDMEEAASLAKVDFCLNVVQNSEHEIVGAFAGEHKKVLRRGAKMIDEMFKCVVKQKADAVIVAADGYPHDINLYQAMKAIQTVIDVVKENGTIVLIAECKEEHGSEKFYNEMEKYENSSQIKKDLMKKFIMGKHKVYYMLNATEKAKIFMTTDMNEEMVSHFRMEKIDGDEILKEIYKRHGKDAKIILSPHASTTLAYLK